MNMINKPSEAIRFAITSGMYVAGDVYEKVTEFGYPIQFMCIAVERMAADRDFSAVVTKQCSLETVTIIENIVGNDFTLASHLTRIDNSYSKLADKYPPKHRFCFNRRLKFWEKFIKNLEKQGL